MNLLSFLESVWSTGKCASKHVSFKLSITKVPQWFSVPACSMADKTFLAVTFARTTNTKKKKYIHAYIYIHTRTHTHTFMALQILNAITVTLRGVEEE